MTSLLLISPAKDQIAPAWVAALKEAMDDLEPIPVPSPAAMPDLIRRHAGSARRVIVGGGDGTMRTVAGALMETGLPLGILPLGTANDLAHSLKIPITPEGAARVISEGRTVPVDLGLVNGHHFFNAAQIGLGAIVKSSAHLKRVLGPVSYAIGAWDAVRRIRSFTVAVTADGRKQSFRSIHVTVGNGKRYGGGTPVAPGASLTDGKLDLFSVDPLPKWKLALVAAALRRGHKGHLPHLHRMRGDRLSLETSHVLSITADGEAVSATPAQFSVLPGAITIYTGERRTA